MADSWNIELTDDLLGMLDDLKGGGHSGSMLKLLDIIESNNDISLLDYGVSNYALGRMFWASGSSRIQEKGEEILSVFEKLSHRDGSVWNESWDNENLATLHNNFNTRMNDILYITTPEEISLKNYYEGIKFYNAGLYEDAEKEFKKAVNRFPNFLYPNIYLGFCERNLGDLQKEFELASDILLEYDKFVLEDSKAYYADFLKGSLAYETKDYSQGVKYLQRCYESYSKDGYINYILGICYLYQNNVKYDIAYRYLSRAKEYGHRIPDNIKKFIQDWENKNKIIPGTDPLV